MWKAWVRPLVRPLPQWTTVAVEPPQRTVSATMRWGQQFTDVTADHTVASLKPLVMASSVDAGPRPTIEYSDNATGKLIGRLQLARMASIDTGDATVVLYRVEDGAHRCLAWPRRPWNAWLQNRLMRKTPSAQHALMEPKGVQQLMVSYLCPRPVVLVSVGEPDHQNIFPMDLIGPLERSGLYSLALRSTNVSAQIMRDSKRVALSHIPATMKALAYQLSEHHRHPLADWQALPFPVQPSRRLAIPTVEQALRVQELAIVHSQEIGSHVLFLCRIVCEDRLADGTQLHHTPGFHQTWRRHRGTPFAEI